MPDQRCRVAVLASGRGSNFKAVVAACRDENFPARVVCLITDDPEAPALELAADAGIESFTVPVTEKKGRLPEADEHKIVDICEQRGVDLIVLAGFMRILKGPLLDRFEGRIMNIHPALLPSFKGLHGVRQALEYGAKVAGCTVHFVDRTIDGGAIILQAVVPVDDDDDENSLFQKVNKEEHRIYVEAVRLFATGRLLQEGRRVRILGNDFSRKG